MSVSPLEALAAVPTPLLSDTLTLGIEHLTHDQATALLGELRAADGADRRADPGRGRQGRRGRHHAYDGCLSAGAWVKAFGHQTSAEAAARCGPRGCCRSGVLPNTAARWPPAACPGRHAAVIGDAVTGAPAGAIA